MQTFAETKKFLQKFSKIEQEYSPLRQKTDTGLRVVSFNVHYAKDPLAVAQAIKSDQNLSNADVILLQEVEYHLKEGKGRATQIAEHLGMECVYAPAAARSRKATHGLAILTNYPIDQIEIIRLPFHVLGFKSRQRIALRIVLDTPNGKAQVYNVHLDTRINPKKRVEQLRAIMDNISAQETMPTIIAGDLNTIQAWFIGGTLPVFFADQRKAVNEFFNEHGYATQTVKGYTMRQGFVRFKLDAIYVSGFDFMHSAVERGVQVSDHAPIWADLQFV